MAGMQALIDTVFEQWKSANAAHMDDDDAWEVFVTSQILRQSDATIDSINAGIVDGADDGGIDAVYTLLEDGVLAIDAPLLSKPEVARDYAEGLELTLHIVQAKNTRSLRQLTVTNLQSVLPQALDLSRDLSDMTYELNDRVREQIGIFRKAYEHLLSRKPKVRVQVTIASHGSTRSLSKNITDRARRLTYQLKQVLPSADINVNLIGADELWEMFNWTSPKTLELECEEVLSSGESYVALARLSSYMRLIVDDHGSLRRHLFDANVRDYQGEVVVNKEIRSSLSEGNGPEFWWLNNGVTILCDEAHSAGKRFALTNIQIVNGLQTSHTIARWHKSISGTVQGQQQLESDSRRLLVRVIVAKDDAVRDKIIRATNRQTAVPDASLRATDEVQRQIEAFFGARGYFYDRRKGFYRNIGKDPSKIISIPYLGQAMFSLAYGGPEVARGKPNSLLAEDARYNRAFDPTTEIEMFFWAAMVFRRVDEHLQLPQSQTRFPERRYLTPFVSYALVVDALQKSPGSWRDIRKLALGGKGFSDAALERAASVVKGELDDFVESTSISAADATKRQVFTQRLASKILGGSG